MAEVLLVMVPVRVSSVPTSPVAGTESVGVRSGLPVIVNVFTGTPTVAQLLPSLNSGMIPPKGVESAQRYTAYCPTAVGTQVPEVTAAEVMVVFKRLPMDLSGVTTPIASTRQSVMISAWPAPG